MVKTESNGRSFMKFLTEWRQSWCSRNNYLKYSQRKPYSEFYVLSKLWPQNISAYLILSGEYGTKTTPKYEQNFLKPVEHCHDSQTYAIAEASKSLIIWTISNPTFFQNIKLLLERCSAGAMTSQHIYKRIHIYIHRLKQSTAHRQQLNIRHTQRRTSTSNSVGRMKSNCRLKEAMEGAPKRLRGCGCCIQYVLIHRKIDDRAIGHRHNGKGISSVRPTPPETDARWTRTANRGSTDGWGRMLKSVKLEFRTEMFPIGRKWR